MPNKPKTPARTFRLSNETMSKLDDLKTEGDTMSDALRSTIDAMHTVSEAMKEDLPAGVTLEAMEAADNVAWLNMFMPQGEADRRLAKALAAAAPHLTAETRRDERQRTLRDVISRLEGHRPNDVSQKVIDSLKSLLD